MNSTAKGNSLEDAFFKYLTDQQKRGDLVYGAYSPYLCKIRKKAKYPCPDRQKPVQFDVVIELYREGGTTPLSYVVFECKNYNSGIPEDQVRVFSDQIASVFGHSVKGILVVASRLKSGAETIARRRSMGIVKFTETGADIVAERRERSDVESAFLKSNIFESEQRVKSLKFSAYYDGRFFSSIAQLLARFTPDSEERASGPATKARVPYISLDEIRAVATEVLDGIGYKRGPVDLAQVCSAMSIELKFTRKNVLDEEGKFILGSANLDRNSIEINRHDNEYRERFTIGHEVGHFCLGHGHFLRSETVVERDLLLDIEQDEDFNLTRLKLQANLFASEIILPDKIFRVAVEAGCGILNMRDIGFGRIYVDDNPWNYLPYNNLISYLSEYFRVSKRATEIRLKKLGLVNDQRRFGNTLSASSLGEVFSRIEMDRF